MTAIGTHAINFRLISTYFCNFVTTKFIFHVARIRQSIGKKWTKQNMKLGQVHTTFKLNLESLCDLNDCVIHQLHKGNTRVLRHSSKQKT